MENSSNATKSKSTTENDNSTVLEISELEYYGIITRIIE